MSGTDFIYIFIIALSLSLDCFAVALSISITWPTLSLKNFIRFPLAFGISQAVMMAIGWAAGNTVVDLIKPYDHWVAFGLLAIIGGRMIWESFHEKDKERVQKDITGWVTLLALSLATSIDSLAAGLSYAFLKINIITAIVTTGLTAFIITLISHLISRRVGMLVGKRAEMIGGLILIIIGLRIIIEHLFAH